MENYVIKEGTFDLPDGFIDRTINSFISAQPAVENFNIAISRDTHFPAENMDDYVLRQLKKLKDAIRGYKVISQGPCRLGESIDGIEVYSSWSEGKKYIYQRQAAFLMGAEQVLIFSATSASAFRQQENTLWQGWLTSFRRR